MTASNIHNLKEQQRYGRAAGKFRLTDAADDPAQGDAAVAAPVQGANPKSPAPDSPAPCADSPSQSSASSTAWLGRDKIESGYRDAAGIIGNAGSRVGTRFASFIPGRSRSLPAGNVSCMPAVASGAGFCWPVSGRVSSGFGGSRDHKGLDICADQGTPISAAGNGTVVYSGHDFSGYGNMVIVDHGEGTSSVYAHNRSNYAQRGDTVKRGQVIAEVGQTGRASTPHCHFVVRRQSTPVDPGRMLP
jgi:murein DD-endopeptidase MepM/ murein hydrolase activator NlpD